MSKKQASPDPKRVKAMSSEEKAGQSSAETLDTLIRELLSMTGRDLDIPIQDIVFQGFKPRVFLIAVQRTATAVGITKEENKKNLLLLGLVCAVRGSKLNKIIMSPGTSPALKTTLTRLRDAYRIVDGRPPSPVAVTLPRCLAVTAIPVSAMIQEDKGVTLSLPLTPNEVTEEYPLVFCMTHAGALLPSSCTANDELAKAVAYGQYLMSMKFGNKTTKHQVMQFVLVATKSNLWSTEVKVAHLVKMGVIRRVENNVVYKDSVERAAALFDEL